MRFVLLTLFVPVFTLAGQDDDTEKLFRVVEKQICKAKAVQVVAEIEAKGTDKLPYPNWGGR